MVPGLVSHTIQGLDSPEAKNVQRHSVPALPGFTLSNDGGFRVVVAPDGTEKAIEEAYQLTSADQWPVDIAVTAIAPGAKPEVIAYAGETGRTMGTHRHGGVEAIVVYNAPGATLQIVSEADFRIGDFFFSVRGPGLPSRILLSIIDGLVDLNR